MAASSVNITMAKDISKDIDEFYGKLEMKYFGGIQREDVAQKLAVQDLFKELSVLKEQTMKSHSEANLREKLKFKKCDLHHMACSEVSYWRKTLMRTQFLTAKHSHPWVIEFTSRLQEDIFEHVVKIITSTSNFGVQIRPGRTSKEQIVEVTRGYLGNEETSLKREFPGKGKTDIFIDIEKPFTLTYNSGSEVLKVRCHYGELSLCSSIYLTLLLNGCSGTVCPGVCVCVCVGGGGEGLFD